MVNEIKLVILKKGENIDTLIKETDTDPSLLYKSLEEFRLTANAAITKLIGDKDDIENCIEEDFNSESEEENICHNPKRKKKL